MSDEKENKSKRMKYLLKSVLRVDVDLIYSVHLAEKVRINTEEWAKYMSKRGGLIVLPGNIISLGKKNAETANA
jgi:hypothetical protein